MEKAVVFIKDKVQDVGYRVFLMERLMETNLDGGAINTLDGRVKLLLCGETKQILAFLERLKEEKPELAEHAVMTEPVFDSTLLIPDKMALCHALQMNQFGKAVNFLAAFREENRESFSKLNENTANGFVELNKNMSSGFAGLNENISNNFGRLDGKYGSIPESLKLINSDIVDGFKELNKNMFSIAKLALFVVVLLSLLYSGITTILFLFH